MEIMDVQNEVFHTNLTIIMPLENMTAEIISPENISGKKLKLGILAIKNLDWICITKNNIFTKVVISAH